MYKLFTCFIASTLLMLVFIVTYWTILIKNDKMPTFDEWTRPYVHVVFPLTLIMMLLFLILFKDYLPACLFGVGVLTAHITNQLLKQLMTRERPSISVLLNAEGYSFPSGHSMIAIVCYGLIAFFIG